MDGTSNVHNAQRDVQSVCRYTTSCTGNHKGGAQHVLQDDVMLVFVHNCLTGHTCMSRFENTAVPSRNVTLHCAVMKPHETMIYYHWRSASGLSCQSSAWFAAEREVRNTGNWSYFVSCGVSEDVCVCVCVHLCVCVCVCVLLRSCFVVLQYVCAAAYSSWTLPPSISPDGTTGTWNYDASLLQDVQDYCRPQGHVCQNLPLS